MITGFNQAQAQYENKDDDEREHPEDCPFCTQDNDDPERWDT